MLFYVHDTNSSPSAISAAFEAPEGVHTDGTDTDVHAARLSQDCHLPVAMLKESAATQIQQLAEDTTVDPEGDDFDDVNTQSSGSVLQFSGQRSSSSSGSRAREHVTSSDQGGSSGSKAAKIAMLDANPLVVKTQVGAPVVHLRQEIAIIRSVGESQVQILREEKMLMNDEPVPGGTLQCAIQQVKRRPVRTPKPQKAISGMSLDDIAMKKAQKDKLRRDTIETYEKEIAIHHVEKMKQREQALAAKDLQVILEERFCCPSQNDQILVSALSSRQESIAPQAFGEGDSPQQVASTYIGKAPLRPNSLQALVSRASSKGRKDLDSLSEMSDVLVLKLERLKTDDIPTHIHKLPIAQGLRQSGVGLTPEWANGATVLVQGLTPESLKEAGFDPEHLRWYYVIVPPEIEKDIVAPFANRPLKERPRWNVLQSEKSRKICHCKIEAY
jgi:hypothetical protein